MPRDGDLGFLTRLYDPEAENGTGPSELQKDGTYIEILMVSTHHEKPNGPSKVPPEVATANGGAGTGLMLELVREVVRKNRGMMKIKTYDGKAMIFFTLILPVEPKKVVRFPQQRPSEERLEG